MTGHVGANLPDVTARFEFAVGDPIVDDVAIPVGDDPLIGNFESVLAELTLHDCSRREFRVNRFDIGLIVAKQLAALPWVADIDIPAGITARLVATTGTPRAQASISR